MQSVSYFSPIGRLDSVVFKMSTMPLIYRSLGTTMKKLASALLLAATIAVVGAAAPASADTLNSAPTIVKPLGPWPVIL